MLPRTTSARVIAMARGLHHEHCCGMTEFSGMWRVTSAGDALAIRKAAYASGNRGVVFATLTNCSGTCQPNCPQKKKVDFVKKAGFRAVKRFKNPRTSSDITIWMADSIKNNITIPLDAAAGQGAYLVPAIAGED